MTPGEFAQTGQWSLSGEASAEPDLGLELPPRLYRLRTRERVQCKQCSLCLLSSEDLGEVLANSRIEEWDCFITLVTAHRGACRTQMWLQCTMLHTQKIPVLCGWDACTPDVEYT